VPRQRPFLAAADCRRSEPLLLCLGETTRRLKALEYSVGQAADGPDPVDKILEGALALPR
jgi:hypothetical protein